MKNAPRGLEGTFRTAAEMERHRAQLADAAIEEQLEVQTAFREHGARLQGIYEKRQRTDVEMARREQEMKQLHGALRSLFPKSVVHLHCLLVCMPLLGYCAYVPVRHYEAMPFELSRA